jgi:hypothetical protein
MNRKKRTIALIMLLAGCVLTCVLLLPHAASAGGISGLVTDAGTGTPLSGAYISCQPYGYSTTTGADGRYTLDNVPPQTYNVSASLSNYHYKTTSGVTVGDAQVQGVDFAMTPATSAVADGFEQDNTLETAKDIFVDASISQFPAQVHNFHQTGDEDWVKFYALGTVANPKSYTITTRNLGTNCDTVITLYDANGTVLRGPINDGWEGEDETLSWNCASAGYYYVKITPSTSTNVGANSNYELSVFIPTGGLGVLFGVVKDALTSLPIANASVTTNSGIELPVLDGSFLRDIAAGQYTLTAYSNGYQVASVANVIVQDGVSTEQDLSLMPLGRLYFPHIASNSLWETEIALVNGSGTETVTGRLKAGNDSGQEVTTGVSTITLAPHARRQITVGSELSNPTQIGSMVFESDSGAIRGYTKFYQNGIYRVAIPAVSSVNTGDLYVTHIASNANWWTGLSLLNTTSQATQATIDFDNGTSQVVSLAANEHKKSTVENLFGGQPQTDIHSAVIRNGNGVIGLELFGNTAAQTARCLEGILLTDDTTTTLFYPQVVSDTNWWTGIVAYNPAAAAATLTIRPYSTAGIALSPTSQTVNAKQKYLGTVEQLGLPTDTAWLRITASSALTGFELIGMRDFNQLAAYCNLSGGGREGILPKLEKQGSTQIALVNLEQTPATVTLTAYNDSGGVIATASLTITAYGKVIDTAETLLGQGLPAATYIGYSSDKNLIGYQLNTSSDSTMLDGLPGL